MAGKLFFGVLTDDLPSGAVRVTVQCGRIEKVMVAPDDKGAMKIVASALYEAADEAALATEGLEWQPKPKADGS